jgi:hypothetical protein
MASRSPMISSSSAPLLPCPQRDLLAHAAVEQAEVVFHLAEIGQQLARQLLELLEAVLDRRVVQQRHVAGQHAGDLGVERVALCAGPPPA